MKKEEEKKVELSCDHNPITEGEGYVAVIDILGFSEICCDNDRIIDLISRFYNLYSEVRSKYKDTLQFIIASDTIFIITKNKSEHCFSKLIEVSSYLLIKYIKWEFPIRGCISYGKYIIYNGKLHDIPPMIYGESLIDAYNYENNLNWIGIILSPLAVRKSAGIDFNYLLEQNPRIQRYKDIPFKDGTYLDGFAILPQGYTRIIVFNDLIKYLEGLKIIAIQKDQIKYENTIKWLQIIREDIEHKEKKKQKKRYLLIKNLSQ